MVFVRVKIHYFYITTITFRNAILTIQMQLLSLPLEVTYYLNVFIVFFFWLFLFGLLKQTAHGVLLVILFTLLSGSGQFQNVPHILYKLTGDWAAI